MPMSYDVIVVGGGHNGLVAAASLARAGRRVLVLERRPTVGGAATTDEIAPGFRASIAGLCWLLNPKIVADLDLRGREVRFLPVDPQVVALGDGKALPIWQDVRSMQGELARASPRDAEAYPGFLGTMRAFAGALDPILAMTPPDVASPSLAEQASLLRRALAVRRIGKSRMQQLLRILPMPVRDVLDETFETELLKASFAVDAVIGMCQGPWSPGTAFGLVRHFLPAARGSAWTWIEGGTGRLCEALAAAARDAGVTIRTDAEVARIRSAAGRVTGVELTDGETIDALVVASNADPKRTFLHLVASEELSPEFLLQIRNYAMNGVVASVQFALGGPPRIASGPDIPPAHFRIAPTMEYIERAYDDAKYGKASSRPLLDAFLPSILDPGLAPSGKHVMSVLVQYAPYALRSGRWEADRERLADRVQGILEAHMPGFERLVLARRTLTPADLETQFGLTEGHIHHGEMTLDQLLVLRPVPGWARYRTPVDGLYLCGSGAHPGGGITGAPGTNAARAILRDWPGLAARA